MRRSLILALSLAFAAPLAGCRAGETAAASPAPDDPGPAIGAVHAAPVNPAQAVAGGPSGVALPPAVPVDSPPGSGPFTLNVTSPPAGKVGAAQTGELQLTPKSGYHVNLDAPLKVVIAPPAGVTVAKTTLDKTDAASLTKDGADYKVALTQTAAGSADVPVTMKFVICDDGLTTCIPTTQNVTWHLTAK